MAKKGGRRVASTGGLSGGKSSERSAGRVLQKGAPAPSLLVRLALALGVLLQPVDKRLGGLAHLGRRIRRHLQHRAGTGLVEPVAAGTKAGSGPGQAQERPAHSGSSGGRRSPCPLPAARQKAGSSRRLAPGIRRWPPASTPAAPLPAPCTLSPTPRRTRPGSGARAPRPRRKAP